MSNDIPHDPENPEWTEEDFRRAVPTAELLGPEVAAALTRKKSTVHTLFEKASHWLTQERLAA